MKLNRLFMCLLLAAALTLPLCLADEVPEAAPTQEATAEPTQAPAPEVTAEPTQTPVPEATAEPEITPEPAPSAEPEVTPEPEATAQATAEPDPSPETTASPEITISPEATVSPEPSISPESTASAEPTNSPEVTITPEITVSPEVTPDPGVTPEPEISPSPEITPIPTPTAPPEPGEAGELVCITPEGNAQDVNGVWNIQSSAPDAPIAFGWTLADGSTAQYYIVYTQNSDGVLTLLQAELADARIELPAANYSAGSFTLHVGAVLEGGISWGRVDFTLAGGKPGGFPGGFPGGMGSFGGSPFGGAAMPGEGEAGFGIVPGKALTDEHASGSMDKTAYTDAAIEVQDEPVSELILGISQAGIRLNGGVFHAQLENGRLTLTPAEGGECWNLSVLAMNTLSGSGIDRIVFNLEGMRISLPTRLELGGSVYGALRSQGYVDKDILLTVDGSGLRASVGSAEYWINDSGELVPLEG